jgi:undecaprenyl-diphosphatase
MPAPDPRPVPASPEARSAGAHRRAVVGLVTALAVAAFLTIAVSTGSDVLDGFDTALTDLTRGWADPADWPVDVAHVLGLVTAPIWSALAASAVVLTLLLTHHRAAAGLLAMSGIAGVTLSETVKMSMGRTRPPGAEEYEQDLDKSFPSGHAMVGIYLYLATGLVLIHLGRSQGRRWMEVVGRVLVVVGPLIGLSRLVLGVHWPSDIIAGWAFGSAVLLASALILWSPLDRGWPTPEQLAQPAAATPPALPGAGTTPAPPAR